MNRYDRRSRIGWTSALQPRGQEVFYIAAAAGSSRQATIRKTAASLWLPIGPDHIFIFRVSENTHSHIQNLWKADIDFLHKMAQKLILAKRTRCVCVCVCVNSINIVPLQK